MKFKNIILSLAIALVLTTAALAQESTSIPTGSKVFIAQMEGGLHSFLAAEVIKHKLPIMVVTEEADADYVLTGASIKADDKWYHSVFGSGKDKNEGSVQLLSVKSKSLVWAGEAGDRSLLFSGWKRGGQRKVAERLISRMQKDLFKK